MEADTLSGSRSTPFERFGSHVAASLFCCTLFMGCLGVVVCVVGCL